MFLQHCDYVADTNQLALFSRSDKPHSSMIAIRMVKPSEIKNEYFDKFASQLTE